MKSIVIAAALQVQIAAVAAAQPSVVTAEGLGPVKFGMSVRELSRALHEPIEEPQDPNDRACFYAEPKQLPPGVSLMIEDGKLTRIDVRTDKIATQAGVRVGTSVPQVKRRYGARLADEPHHYGGPDDRYLTVSLTRTVSARFETSGVKVDNFYVGYTAQVRYVEGCL